MSRTPPSPITSLAPSREPGPTARTRRAQERAGRARGQRSSRALVRELVAHLRRSRTRLRQEWARHIAEAELLVAMSEEEIFAEATSVYDNYVAALETGTFEALQAYARNLSERIIPRGVETREVVGIVLLLRDVLARSLFAKYRRNFTKLNQILDAYEPAANNIANTVAVGFVQERERVIVQQQEALREIFALRRMNETLEQEIQRMALAVHDEAGQLLVAARLSMSTVAKGLDPSAQERLQEVGAILDQLEAELRRLSHELWPPLLDDLGLVPALRALASGVSRRSGTDVRVEGSLLARPPLNVEITVYRVVQEALANVAKHARAASVEIRIRGEARGLCFVVRDDGVGFDAAAALSNGETRGLGLLGIRERLRAIGGTLQIESMMNRGTELRITVPVEAELGNPSGPRGQPRARPSGVEGAAGV